MYRRLYNRSLVIQSQLCLNLVSVKNIVYSSNRFHGLIVKPSVNKLSYMQFCSIRKSIERETKPELEFENDPNVLEIENRLECTKSEAIAVYKYFSKNNIHVDLKSMNKIVKWLHRLGAETSIIFKNCHLFLMPIDSLKKTYNRLKVCEWKQFVDFMPLLSINESKIKSIQRHNIHEVRNRVYLFSKSFSCEPHIVSHHCAKHVFMFERDSELLKRKITLLENNISPEYILRDLDLLARAECKIKARIEYLQMCDVGHIMPWMIKCEDRILHRTLEIREKIVGAESVRTLELLHKRLNLHGRTAIAIFSRNKFLRELHYETVIERLEELLRVFTPKEIAENIKLLNHPVAHIKIRVAELNALDPSSNISPKLCGMSEKNFIEYKKAIKK